jgi:hypothetical protein
VKKGGQVVFLPMLAGGGQGVGGGSVQSKELTRGLTELVQHCRLKGELTSAQERCMT